MHLYSTTTDSITFHVPESIFVVYSRPKRPQRGGNLLILF